MYLVFLISNYFVIHIVKKSNIILNNIVAFSLFYHRLYGQLTRRERTLKIHIVQKGDTLWTIAKKYNVNFEELKKLNTQLSNPEMIMPGMKIKIPVQKQVIKQESPKISLQGNKKEVIISAQDKINQLTTKEKIVPTKEQAVPTKESVVPPKEQVVPMKEIIVPTKETPKPITMPTPPVQQPAPTTTPKTKVIPIPVPIPIPIPKSTPAPKSEPTPVPKEKEKIVEPIVEQPIKPYIPKMQQEKPKVEKPKIDIIQKEEIVIKEKIDMECQQTVNECVNPCDIPACTPEEITQFQQMNNSCQPYTNWQVSPHQVQPIMMPQANETMNCSNMQEMQEQKMQVAPTQMNTMPMQPDHCAPMQQVQGQSWMHHSTDSMQSGQYTPVQQAQEQSWANNQNQMQTWTNNYNPEMTQMNMNQGQVGNHMEEDCGCQDREDLPRDPSLLFQPYPPVTNMAPMQNMMNNSMNPMMPNQKPNQMPNQMNPMMPNQMNPMMPNQMPNQMNPMMPNYMPNQMNPMMPNQMPNQMNPMMPNYMPYPMDPMMPNQMPNQMNPMMPNQMPNQMNLMMPNQMQGSKMQPYQPLVYPPQFNGQPNFNFQQELPQMMTPEFRGQPAIPQIPPFGYMNQEQRGGQQGAQQAFGNQTSFPQAINPFSNQPNDRK